MKGFDFDIVSFICEIIGWHRGFGASTSTVTFSYIYTTILNNNGYYNSELY